MGNNCNASPASNGAHSQSSAGIRSLASFTAEIGKTPSTVWRWRKQGWLDVLNICGKLYVTSEAIERFKARAAAGEFSKAPVVPQRTKEESA
jgi:hypothetical protein